MLTLPGAAAHGGVSIGMTLQNDDPPPLALAPTGLLDCCSALRPSSLPAALEMAPPLLAAALCVLSFSLEFSSCLLS